MVDIRPNGLGTASLSFECQGGLLLDGDYVLVVTDAQNKRKVTGIRVVLTTFFEAVPTIVTYQLNRLPAGGSEEDED